MLLSIHPSLIVLALSIIHNVFGESSQILQITPSTKEHLRVLKTIETTVQGAMFWNDPTGLNRTVDVMIPYEKSRYFKNFAEKHDLSYKVVIPDVNSLLNETYPSNSESESFLRIRNQPYQKRAYNFHPHKFNTLDDINRWLDSLAANYPKNVKTVTIGNSFEGRPIKGVHLRLSGVERPAIFIEGGIHAREWLSHATAIYLINGLINGQDQGVRWLGQAFDWYIFPCVNPDGYAYTQIDPANSNYRLWRKSRSRTSDQSTCYGADINRNWDHYWGGPGSDRSNQCSEIYSGKKAFSEPESAVLARFAKSISNKLFSYISFHSYIQTLMFPYGHTTQHLDNYDQQMTAGRAAVRALSRRYGTRYQVGNLAEILRGPSSGSSLDWIKANLRTPFVYCYELRGKTSSGRYYGFVAPASEIVPNGQEVVDSLVALLSSAAKLRNPYRY